MSNEIKEANWKFHWRLTESAGIMIYLADYRGRRVLWEASLPYVTVDHQRETLELRDPMRHLTPHGRTEAKSLGDRLRWHDCEPTQLWSSPLVRAVQTAELVATGLGCQAAVETMPALAPDDHPRSVVAALAALPASAIVVLVGHEREPQAQFREAHGSGRHIYAEQRMGEHVAFHGQGRSLAGSAPERHQLVESAEQEGS